jgi:membrane associated rhomboid family serine protease
MNQLRYHGGKGRASGSEEGFQRREPFFNIPAIVLAIIGACVVVHILRDYVLDPESDFAVLLRYGFVPARWSGDIGFDIYALISPFTYAFLHGSLAHLVINSIWLAAFGSPLANRLGAIRFAIFWLVTSFFSAAAYFVMHMDSFVPVIGASGAISAMMGAAARFGFQTARLGRQRAFAGPVLPLGLVFQSRTVLAFLAVWFGANFLAGAGVFGPEDGAVVAWEAHIGGFLSGFVLLPLFVRQ